MSSSGGRTLEGVVVSDQRDKTIAVKVTRQVKHPFYGKYVLKSKKFHAHDIDNAGKVGDRVRIIECAPISKSKTWKLETILEKARESQG